MYYTAALPWNGTAIEAFISEIKWFEKKDADYIAYYFPLVFSQ